MKTNRFFWIFGLSALTYFIQGAESLPAQAFFIYLKNTLKLSPSNIMYLASLTGIAWCVKPILGFYIDNYFSKKTWYIFALILSLFVVTILGLNFYSLFILIFMLTLKDTDASIRDVAVDGIMVVEGQKHNLCGKIQSVQWISITVASIIVGVVGGYIAQANNYRLGFLLLIPIYIIALIFVLNYKEEKIIREKTNLIENLRKYKLLWRDKRFVYTCLFFFFYCYSPSFGTPLSFLQRDLFHWNERFIGILGTVLSVLEILGALLYYKLCSKLNVKKWLIASVFIGATTSLLYLYYTPISAIVYGIIFSIVGMFIHLILMGFVANNCIKGLEATSFALLCAVHNFAGTCSNLSGAWLYPKIGLNWLIIISSVTSFICLLWIKYLNIEQSKGICTIEKCKC